jgi:hypothetical protein
MNSTAFEILDVLNATQVRGLAGSGGVWRLNGIAAQYESIRERLLSIAARSSPLFVHYDGDKPDGPSLAETVALAENVWRLPALASGRDLNSWLYMGNWQLYSRETPLTKLEDLCRADADGVMRFVQSTGVRFVIDSFHDNIQWTIGLADHSPHDTRSVTGPARER